MGNSHRERCIIVEGREARSRLGIWKGRRKIGTIKPKDGCNRIGDGRHMTKKELVIGERGTQSICLVLIAAIFVLDAATPSGYSACFLYILPVFFCLGLQNDRTIYGVALICTVLTILAVPFEPSSTLTIDLFNRPIAIAGIWIVVSVGIQRRRFERDIEKKAFELAQANAILKQQKMR